MRESIQGDVQIGRKFNNKKLKQKIRQNSGSRIHERAFFKSKYLDIKIRIIINKTNKKLI